MNQRPARHRHAVKALLLATVALAAACGGAESAPKSPAQENVEAPREDKLPEPRTIEEAQDQIARAEEDLGASKKTSKSAESTAPSAGAEPQGGGAAREEKLTSTCESPCRALASMKRAVEALCRMTGDTDNRCVDARRTLDDNTTRVSTCKCEAR
ncbi:MAG: hypothetical protein KF764_21495 [Labilithrix sp.]|nr:hypothetical protein [Labilithrix sp.]MBX3223047.1 hypothetical protein [Labilithrix sp.]